MSNQEIKTEILLKLSVEMPDYVDIPDHAYHIGHTKYSNNNLKDGIKILKAFEKFVDSCNEAGFEFDYEIYSLNKKKIFRIFKSNNNYKFNSERN